MAIRIFSAGIKLTSALTLAGAITLTQGATTKALTLSTTIAAGVYDVFSFAAKVNSQLRDDIRTKALAASITTVPAAANILLKFTFPSSFVDTINGNKINVTFDATGFLFSGVQMTLTVFTLNNASGWATKLGLDKESNATITATIANPVGTINGAFQPRSLFVTENSYKDTWDNEAFPFESTMALANGKVRRFSRGSSESTREIEAVDLEPEYAGYPLEVKSFSSFGANNSILNLTAPDTTGLVNVSNINSNLTVAQGDLIRISNDNFYSRVESVSTNVINLYEKVPSTITPTAGDPIYKISELHALWIEALRTDYIFVYEPDDSTGQSKFKPSAYALNLNGKHLLNFTSRDIFTNLYSVVFSLFRRQTPETVVI